MGEFITVATVEIRCSDLEERPWQEAESSVISSRPSATAPLASTAEFTLRSRPSMKKMKVKVTQSCPTLLRHHGLYSPWNSLGQNAGVGSLSLLQGIFPTQASHIAGGSLPALLACKVLILFSKKAPDSLPEWLSHFTLPPAIDKRFSFFPSLWLFSLVTGFDHSCSDGCVVIFPYDFLSFFVFLIALVCFSVFVSAGSSWLSAGFL